MHKVYEHFGLGENTVDFIGHAVALYTNDDYIKKPMGVTMEKIKLYMYSLARYGQSPFIYPVGFLEDKHTFVYVVEYFNDWKLERQQSRSLGVNILSWGCCCSPCRTSC